MPGEHEQPLSGDTIARDLRSLALQAHPPETVAEWDEALVKLTAERDVAELKRDSRRVADINGFIDLALAERFRLDPVQR